MASASTSSASASSLANDQPSTSAHEGIVANGQEVTDLSPEEATGPFEGPEKLLELWWSDSADQAPEGGKGLRSVSRKDWEGMLDEVHCKVLSVIEGHGVDAYLLRWVSG